MILRGHKLSIQNGLNKFFCAIGALFCVTTASAYSQARKKINPAVFLHLNKVVQQEFYTLYGADEQVKLWRGHRLLGADGTYVNVPDTAETRQVLSVQTNQYKGAERVQALASVLYDLRNDIGLDAVLGPIQAEKNLLFQHLQVTEPGDVIVLDRNYADYAVMAMLHSQARDFIIRFPAQSFALVNAFWKSAARDIVMELKASDKAKAFVRAHQLPAVIRVRFMKVWLESGEIEVLGTSLLDTTQYPTDEFKQVYGWRWNNETYYDRLKNIFEVERFSSPSVLGIKQDFYGVIFLATLEAILIKPAQDKLTMCNQEHGWRNQQKINRAISYVTLVDHVVNLLCDKHSSPQQTLAELEFLFLTNPTGHRQGRQFPRDKTRHHARKLFFAKYVKRIFA
jgi:Transposase DDE domain